jgi:hemerythrin-like domain-containing protein
MHEHRLIERLLAVVKQEIASLQAGNPPDLELAGQVVWFFRAYADRCHHGKEEDILFRRLAEKHPDEDLASMMAGLIQDHVRGREMTRRLTDANDRYRAGDTSALGSIESCLRELIEFYPVHIEKEDRHFFKPCLEHFTDAERQQMLPDFDEFDRALIHEKYRGIVEALERASG